MSDLKLTGRFVCVHKTLPIKIYIQQMTKGYVSHIYLLLSGDVDEKYIFNK